MPLQEEIDAKRREIHTEGYPMSVGELVNLYRDDELDIHPEFQRFFRWEASQKSRFVESLLLGIPIPSIFVHQRQDGVWDVIDGLQRLSTVFEFMGELLNDDGERIAPLALESTEYLPSLEGLLWESDEEETCLNPDQRRLIKRASIDIKIVKRESDADTKFDLFQRLNTGGSQLSDQEVRNCLLIMVDPDFYRWSDGLKGLDAFQKTVAPSDRAVDEQYDGELVIRFLALKDATEQTLSRVRDMKDFLDSFSVEEAGDAAYDRDNQRTEFVQTFQVLESALAESSFRRYSAASDRFLGGFSVAAFEAVTVGVFRNLDRWTGEQDPEVLRRRVKDLWSQDTFKDNTGSGVRASTRISRIIPFAAEWFSD